MTTPDSATRRKQLLDLFTAGIISPDELKSPLAS